MPHIAQIATYAQGGCCDHRSFARLRFAQDSPMEIIDAKWVAKHLTGRRGELADLARALGVPLPAVSRIKSGERRVQPEEIPAILAFFKVSADTEDNVGARVSRLSARRQRLLREILRDLEAAEEADREGQETGDDAEGTGP